MGSVFGGIGDGLNSALGKKKPPKAPDFTSAALATSNASRYNEVGPNGSVTWALRPGADPKNPGVGDYTRTTSMSPIEQQLYDQSAQQRLRLGGLAGTMMGQPGLDRDQLEKSMFDRSTRLLQPQFDQTEAALRSRLQNSGLTEGSQAWDTEMGNFNRGRDVAYQQAADNAVVNSASQFDSSQNSAIDRLLAVMQSSRGQAPQSANNNVPGTDFLGAAKDQYSAALGRTNASNAQTADTNQAMLQALMYAFGASDRRLKTAVTPVPGGKGGLQAYRYKIFGREETGYMADEVAAVYPAAVITLPSGYQAVCYAMIGGRP